MASDEYHRRTLITRLSLRSTEDEQLLFGTIEEWLDGCNIARDRYTRHDPLRGRVH